MTANQAVFPVQMMARVMGVSHSGFYAWMSRPTSARAMTARRLISGDVLKYLNGERLVIESGYETALPD